MTRRHRDERGTATAFILGFAIVLLACAGLVVDGGTAINERMKLADNTEQAARAGAQAIDLTALREDNVVRLDPAAARAAADGYLAGIGYSNYSADVVRDAAGQYTSVRVVAKDTVPTTMLRLIHIGSFDINATATAQAVTR